MDKKYDWLDSIKSGFKKYPRFYRMLIQVISPVFSFEESSYVKLLQYINKQDKFIVNIGSGPFNLESEFINVDINKYKNVKVLADAQFLPFKNESLDAIVNIVVLEHISEPEKAMEEMYRVLKKGGYIYTDVPFLEGYHASPYDYKRWTASGIQKLHENFEEIEKGVRGGPTSSLVWVLTEWFAIFFSFHNQVLYKILYIFFMLILWPFKFLDVFLIGHPMAKNIACTFYFIGRKI
jgi:SAM-dependent methyltransferase